MKLLSRSAYETAKNYLATESRGLEWSLYEYHFQGNTNAQEKVLEELMCFRNPDGGFGKALEPDVRMPGSSVVATKFALQILIDIQTTSEQRLVQDAVNFLLTSYNPEKGTWSLVNEDVMGYPHAPWWDFAGLESEFGSFLANPKAGILRCLLHYQELVPEEFTNLITRSLLEHLNHLPENMGLFDMIGFLQLLQAQWLGEVDRQNITSKMERIAATMISSNPVEWSSFAIKPLWLAPSPQAPLAKVLAESIQTNLDFEIENQNPDGSWSPTWSWGDNFRQSWTTAESEWKGILTLAMLRSLRDYARVEGLPPNPGYKYHID